MNTETIYPTVNYEEDLVGLPNRVTKKEKIYHILYNTLQDCIEYFYKNLEQANSKSEHNKTFKCDGVKVKYVKGGY